MRIGQGLWAAVCLVLAGCVEQAPDPTRQDAPRILALGDSMMAWNSGASASVSHAMENTLGEEIVDRSVVGASVLYALPISGSLGLRISAQFVPGNWDWVVMNGGGNDLWLGCGCKPCDKQMDRMLSADGKTGRVADLVAQIRKGGAKVIYLGYLRTPGRDSPVDACRDLGDAFEQRLTSMAARDRGVFFISNADLVPNRDLSFHAADRVHPSPKGSAAIAARAARIISRSR